MLRLTYHRKSKSIWCSRRGSIGFRIYEDEIKQLKEFKENLTKHNSRKIQSAKCGCDCHIYYIDKKDCKCKKGCESEAD